MRLRPLLATLLLCGSLYGLSETRLTIAPGGLAASVADIPTDETRLILDGEAGVDDLRLLTEMHATIKAIDISALRIVASATANPLYGVAVFPADHLPAYVFATLSAEQLILPSTLRSIGEGALAGSNVADIRIPSSVATIGDYAFAGSSLCSVTGGEGLRSIGKGAFQGCRQLTSADISSGKLSHLPDHLFSGCPSLSTLRLPSTIQSVGEMIIAGTTVAGINLPLLSHTADYALAGAETLREVAIPEVAMMAEGLFASDRSLTTLSQTASDVKALSYAGCSSLDIEPILANAEYVGADAFAGTRCERMVLGPDLLRIDSGAFTHIAGLSEINAEALGNQLPLTAPDIFGDSDLRAIPLIVARGTLTLWKTHPVWGLFDIRESLSAQDIRDDSDGFRLFIKEGAIHASAPKAIDSLRVYTLSGTLLRASSPLTAEATLDISDIQENVIILTLTSGSHTESSKFILR